MLLVGAVLVRECLAEGLLLRLPLGDVALRQAVEVRRRRLARALEAQPELLQRLILAQLLHHLQLEVERVRDALHSRLSGAARSASRRRPCAAWVPWHATALPPCPQRVAPYRRWLQLEQPPWWRRWRLPLPHREHRMPPPPRQGRARPLAELLVHGRPSRSTGRTSHIRQPTTRACSRAPPAREACYSRCVRRWMSGSLPV